MNGSTSGAGALRVLCMEDSPVDAELVREVLAGAVLQLEWDMASDRRSFEELLAGGPYDVILADYALPGFDAHGALHLARVACPTTPFICVSGKIGEEATVELLKEGADDCVLKDRLARLPFAVQRAIDERAREQELRQSEKKYATVFHASPDSITVTRLSDGEILEANEGFERLLGYTRAESIGKTTADLSAYADPGARDGLVTGLRETGELSDFDATLRRKDGTKDGTLAEVILSARVIEFHGEECLLAVAHDITERNKAEADRLHAEKFFRDTFEHADVGIAHVNSAGGTWLRVNQCMCDLLGYTREELLATTFAAITHPDDVDENVRHLRRMLAGDEETYAADKRFLRKDGSIIWVHLNVAPIRKADGTPDYNITVMLDITDRKLAEKTLKRSEQNLNLSVGRVGTWNWDLVTDELEWSPRAKAMFGLPEDAAVTHESFLAALHPDDREGADAAIKEALAGKTDCDMEYRAVWPDGTVRWIYDLGRAYQDASGKSVRMAGSMLDITDRKLAEDALAASERFSQRVLDTSPSLIYIYDLVEGRNTYTNREITEFLGYTSEDALAFGPTLFEHILHPDDTALVAEHHERLHKLPPADDSVLEIDYRMKHSDGEWRWLHSRDIPFLRDGTGTVTQILGSTDDITEQRVATELAVRQGERIERTLTSVIDIAGSIGELRDPYTAGHQRRVAELAARMAQELGMSDLEVADVHVAALLHDIGKVAVPTEILGKPGLISPVELELIKGHAEAGYEIAVSANLEEPIPEMIRQHHERCDGSGYPRGLLGDQMLQGAKVLAVADVVEAMMSHRPYRPALGIDAALAEIERGVGRLYDVEVSRVCVALFRGGGFEFS